MMDFPLLRWGKEEEESLLLIVFLLNVDSHMDCTEDSQEGPWLIALCADIG